jgi:hypothetical protein
LEWVEYRTLPAGRPAIACRPAPGQPDVLATFDDQNPGITSRVTLPGYDNMTGLGTPNVRINRGTQEPPW